MEKPIVLVVETNRLSWEGLRLILQGSLYLVSDALSVDDFLSAEPASRLNLVIWGANVPVSDVRKDILKIRKQTASANPPVRLVILAQSSNRSAIRRLVALHVDAVLMHDISGDILQRYLELVMLDQQVFPRIYASFPADESNAADVAPEPATLMPRRHHDPPSHGNSQDLGLSGRESQILQLLADAAANKTIARELGITEATVKAHVKSVLRKLRASNRTQAAIWAINNLDRSGSAPPNGSNSG